MNRKNKREDFGKGSSESYDSGTGPKEQVSNSRNSTRPDKSRSATTSKSRQPFGGAIGSGYGDIISKTFYPIELASGGRQPSSQMVLPDGSSYVTPYGRDPIRTNKIEVAVFEYFGARWDLFQSTGGTDPSATLVAQRVLQIFQLMVDTINYNGRFTPNQILTTAGDFATYLNNYTNALTGLNTLMSIADGIDLNQSMRIIATTLASGGLLDRLAMDWRRLQLIPVPPELPLLLLKLSGIYANDAQEVVYMSHVNAGASPTHVTDFTLNAGVDSISALLTTIETDLNTLEVGTSEGNIIQEVMAMVYGAPKPLPQPMVHREPGLYDLNFTRGVAYEDLTAVTFMFMPNLSSAVATTGIMPVLQRRGLTPEPLLATLFRPNAYCTQDTGFNAAFHSTGLFTPNAGAPTFARVYGPASVNNTILTDAQTTANFGTLNFQGNLFYELEWWSPLAGSTKASTRYDFDNRNYDRWDEFYVQTISMASSTIQLLDEIFLIDTRIRALR